jgi:hypothetical protein
MLNGETVSNVLIGKHKFDQIAHNLMHLDQNLPSILRVKATVSTCGLISLHCSV